jgi:hypothetical protein
MVCRRWYPTDLSDAGRELVEPLIRGRCPEFLHSNAGFDRYARTGLALYRWCRVDLVEEALNLRGSLRGRTVPGDADSGLSPLASASVLPGQGLYLGRANHPAGHGKEKVYGSIP